MINLIKEARQFQSQYKCNWNLALKAACLSSSFCNSNKIYEIQDVTFHKGMSNCKTEVLILECSALAVWLFTNYSTKGKTSVVLSTDIYPLVSMVLNIPKDSIPVKLRSLAKSISKNLLPSQLIFDVLDEAIANSQL